MEWPLEARLRVGKVKRWTCFTFYAFLYLLIHFAVGRYYLDVKIKQTHISLMWNLMNTELTRKIETDAWMESRLTAKGGGCGGGMEQKGKRTHGHGEQCSDCRTEGRGV